MLIKQNLKLTQKLQITQINAMKMLSIEKKELIKIISDEIENNEYLQVDSSKIFFETLKTYQVRKFLYKENDDNKTQYEIALDKTSPKPSLQEHLLLQLRIQRLSEAEIHIVEIIINNLNSRGLYIINPYDFFTKEDWSQVNKMIELIRKFDPIGICVPNIIESLILQAKYHKLDAKIIKILEKAD